MASTQNTMNTSLLAGANLEDGQYKGATLHPDEDKTVVPIGIIGDFGFVLQNAPRAGEGAIVCFAGRTLVVTSAAYDRRSPVSFAGDGTVKAAVDDDPWVIGYALEASAGAGEVREIFVTYTRQA